MLRRIRVIACLALALMCLPFGVPTSIAKSYITHTNAGGLEAGNTATSTPSKVPSDDEPVPDDTVPAGSPGCWWGNTQVDCMQGEQYYWSSLLNMYCMRSDPPAENPLWDQHRLADGSLDGAYYLCHYPTNSGVGYEDTRIWQKTPLATPPKPGSDPVGAIRVAIDSLQLHPPVAGVGAYTYPKYEHWGLSWWVGAPMWLWIDTDDPLQWGTHSLAAYLDDDGISATVTATTATFDPGDGTDPIVCHGPGTGRPWNTKGPPRPPLPLEVRAHLPRDQPARRPRLALHRHRHRHLAGRLDHQRRPSRPVHPQPGLPGQPHHPRRQPPRRHHLGVTQPGPNQRGTSRDGRIVSLLGKTIRQSPPRTGQADGTPPTVGYPTRTSHPQQWQLLATTRHQLAVGSVSRSDTPGGVNLSRSCPPNGPFCVKN
jgi:hypothetical protein